MKSIYLIILFITSLLVSCGEEDANCTPESIIGNFTIGKQIVVEYDTAYQRNNYLIENGNNIVFEYKHAKAQCENTYDDELLEVFTFEVDKNADQFRFGDEQIFSSKSFYHQIGAWVRLNRYEVKSGIIEGEKISESKWKVKVSVLTSPLFPDEEPKKIEFEQVFEK